MSYPLPPSSLTFYEFIHDSAIPSGFPYAAYFQHDLNFGCASMPMTAICWVVAAGTIIGVCLDAANIQLFCK